jgi:hypothetical protein
MKYHQISEYSNNIHSVAVSLRQPSIPSREFALGITVNRLVYRFPFGVSRRCNMGASCFLLDGDSMRERRCMMNAVSACLRVHRPASAQTRRTNNLIRDYANALPLRSRKADRKRARAGNRARAAKKQETTTKSRPNRASNRRGAFVTLKTPFFHEVRT